MGIPNKEYRPSKNKNIWMCKAWLGNSERWCGTQHRGTGKEKGPESHFGKGLQGDQKLLNKANAVLAAMQK